MNVSGTNNQLAITLLIDSIKSPDRDYADSDYKWSVYQYRLFTPVVVDYWTDTGIRTNPGSLSISWTPHNGYSISEIVQGLTMYMDITITPAHAIPTTGVINLTFSSIDIEAPRYIFPDT